MFLKQLIVKGFKTFADKVVLEFNSSGITAVVGPNGCGKSNIVDSFRFALGEGNIRELRVSTLPEVIFAGTSLRKPLSLAETTLVFDNQMRYLPLEYSEVSVKRRTYRDGESEFSINGQAARLKDIRNVFLDTGLSSDSLCIIGQGRVDAILSSKPEERRAVFEEAVGINKYRVRKIEAEKKLILAEQSLLRIADLKVEIGEQSVVLEEQAAKARQYVDLQKRLKDIEIGIFKKQAESLLKKKAALEDRITELKNSEEQFERREAEKADERHNLKAGLEKLDLDIEGVMGEIEDARNKVETEKNSRAIERERQLFAQKEKVRDIKEEQRFVDFEIQKLEDTVRQIQSGSKDVEKKIKEIDNHDLGKYGHLKETLEIVEEMICLTRGLVESFGYGEYHPAVLKTGEERLVKMLQEDRERQLEQLGELAGTLKQKQDHKQALLVRLAEVNAKLFEEEQKPSQPAANEVIDQLVQKRSELEKKMEELKKQRISLLERMESASQMEDRKQEVAAREELSSLRVQLARVEGDLSHVLERALSEYMLGCKELLESEQQAANLPRAKLDADEIRHKLRELEPVNLLAIDEYDRIKERHTFIQQQYDDLNSAVQNLKELIFELDKKAREDFALGMEKISRNFSEIFGQLFSGGEARIEIARDKDLLDAGIDISVCPSGRKWLNLALLSGGERSLTAIAILFAILKTSPNPLCVLDEVDAALDDANIDRFAQFLKNYSSQTQIVVITHNKQTMAVADTIYGVTMEEPGVSKLISIQLEKV
ncbi:MAG: AAA family ATPase [Candidatus Margulisiibacteriota bacterium]